MSKTDRMLARQKANPTKRKYNEMQRRQNEITTKCKYDKMQIRRNAKIPNINDPKPPYSRPPHLMH